MKKNDGLIIILILLAIIYFYFYSSKPQNISPGLSLVGYDRNGNQIDYQNQVSTLPLLSAFPVIYQGAQQIVRWAYFSLTATVTNTGTVPINVSLYNDSPSPSQIPAPYDCTPGLPCGKEPTVLSTALSWYYGKNFTILPGQSFNFTTSRPCNTNADCNPWTNGINYIQGISPVYGQTMYCVSVANSCAAKLDCSYSNFPPCPNTFICADTTCQWQEQYGAQRSGALNLGQSITLATGGGVIYNGMHITGCNSAANQCLVRVDAGYFNGGNCYPYNISVGIVGVATIGNNTQTMVGQGQWNLTIHDPANSVIC